MSDFGELFKIWLAFVIGAAALAGAAVAAIAFGVVSWLF